MELTCPTCATATTVPDDRLPPEGARARCHSCQHVSVYYRGGLVADDPTPPRDMPAVEAAGVSDDPTPERHLSAVNPAEGAVPPHPRLALPAIPLGRSAYAEAAAERAAAGAAAAAAAAAVPASSGWQIRTARGDEGPLALEALRPLIRDGKLGPDDLGCPPGQREWIRAGDLPALARWFAAAKKAAAAAPAKPAPSGAAVASCSQHPGVRGRWLCPSCGQLSCDQCVLTEEVARVTVRQCPRCRKSCTELVPTKVITPFWEEIPSLLAYPFRGLGWLGLILCPMLGFGAVLAGAAGAVFVMAWGAKWFLLAFIYSYHLFIIRETSQGARSMPNLGKVENFREDMLWPSVKAALVSSILFLPAGWATRDARGMQLQVGIARGMLASVQEDRAEWEQRKDDPESAQQPAEDPTASLESAVTAIGTDGDWTPDEAGEAMGRAVGGLSWGGARDFDAEEREARAALREAESRLTTRRIVQVITVAAALGIWPIILIVLALFNSIMPVFQPQILMKLIAEIPRQYAWCTAITSACFLGIWALNLPFRNVLVFNNWLTSPLTYYLSFIAFHVMGRTAELAEREIDFH